MEALTRPLWAHQQSAIEQAYQAEREGFRCLAIASPTGGGKRTIIVRGAHETAAEGGRAIIFTNRRIITKQTKDEMSGLDFGMIAAGYPAAMGENVLLASVQTVQRRGGLLNLPDATRVFIDEGHWSGFHPIARAYAARGVPVWMLTATPVGLKGTADKLIVAGTTPELQGAGHLVKCHVHSPEQPHIKGVKRTKSGEFYQPQLRKMFATYQTEVFGNVVEWWNQLNPWHLPTLLWAPGVAESRWFVEELGRQGIPAAHIDGTTEEDERDRIRDGSKDGSIKIVCSYGVLREGADWPWIRHGILIQVCGALSTYLQIVGRLLRAFEGKDSCILQDHSGAMWRHGSPNAAREWTLENTDKSIAQATIAARKEGKEPEPIRCPSCGGERLKGPKCPHCGHEHEKSVRMVRMTGGKLVKVTGAMVKKRNQDQGERQWISCLYAAAARGRTVAQASGDYNRRTGKWPEATFKCVPSRGSIDWKRRVSDVWHWFGKRKQKA